MFQNTVRVNKNKQDNDKLIFSYCKRYEVDYEINTESYKIHNYIMDG
jgi:hypothetical protein